MADLSVTLSDQWSRIGFSVAEGTLGHKPVPDGQTVMPFRLAYRLGRAPYRDRVRTPTASSPFAKETTC